VVDEWLGLRGRERGGALGEEVGVGLVDRE